MTFFYPFFVAIKRDAEEIQLLILFGNRLRELRNLHGLTQEEMAHQAGFSRSYYTEIETGKRNVSLLNLYKLAQCLDMELKDLVNIEAGEGV